MKIIACYKWVLDEADLVVNPDLSLNTSRAAGKISDYDRNAVQVAMEAAGAEDEVIALTFAPAEAQKSLKDVLSRGPALAVWVKDEAAATADGAATAKVLAAAVRHIGDTRLVVCAEGASDTYAHEVGPRLGALLDWPVISNVRRVTVDGNALTATRLLNEQVESVRVQLPAVITVLPEAAPAPIPGLKMVLAASKKPVKEYGLAELGLNAAELTPKTTTLTLNGFALNRKNVVFDDGEPGDLVRQLVDALVLEGVLS
jgi:electron transfer flavoprotein beta subunit